MIRDIIKAINLFEKVNLIQLQCNATTQISKLCSEGPSTVTQVFLCPVCLYILFLIANK